MNDYDEMEETPSQLPARIINRGTKGTDIMNIKSKEELKELRKDIIETTRNMMGRGFTYKMKMDALATQYGVSTRQAKKYIKYTREDIQKRRQEDYAMEFDLVLIKLDTLYREMMAAGKLDQAAKVLGQLITLRGYEAPKAIMVKQQVDFRHDLSHLTEAQLLQITSLLDVATSATEA